MTDLPRKTSDYASLIERAATDPNFDVAKLQALLDMREAEEMRHAEKAFTAALVKAQAQMSPVVADANNPQTRSRYATYAALDRAIKPHYTAHGLAPTFSTEPINEPGMMRVIGILGHLDGFVRRYQIDMPVDTKGIKGVDMMTRTHATGSALTYGKRYLLIAMFNLAISDSDDDDGNAATRLQPRQIRDLPRIRSMDELQHYDDPIEPEEPHQIEVKTWGDFIDALKPAILQSKTIEEVDAWMTLNQDTLLKMRELKPDLFRAFEKAIEPRKAALQRE